MDKKIGKLLLFFSVVLASCTMSAQDFSVSLRVTDQQGHFLKEAGIGVPFLIQVEVINKGKKDSSRPQLSLPPEITLGQLGTTSSIRTINNDTVSKKTYQYSAVSNQVGTFTIGPALVHIPGGDEIRSNIVAVKIAERPKLTESAEKEAHQVFVEFSADTTAPYVGQAVTVSLRFYYSDDSVHLDHLQEPVFKDCKSSGLQGPRNGQATVDGVQYGYLEWQTTLFPTHAGTIVIPAVGAQVSMPMERSSHRMDMFSLVNQMLGTGRQKQIYSNSLTLMVHDLPAHGKKNVRAVGKFSSLHGKLGSEKASVGEGINFTLELVGEGNFQMINHPSLILPESLRYYDSHVKEHQLTDKMKKKDFEYVLQGLKPGEYDIPAQAFEYFDGKTKSYKTLHSRPLKITITGEEKRKTETSSTTGQSQSAGSDLPDNLGPESTLNGGGTGRIRCIAWPWFMGILFVLLLIIVGRFLWMGWLGYREKNASYFVSRDAFYQAERSLKKARKEKKYAEIYHIFITLFCSRLSVSAADVSEEIIERTLKEKGFSAAQIIAWRQFFARTLAVTFAVLPETDDLWAEAEKWLALLKGIL